MVSAQVATKHTVTPSDATPDVLHRNWWLVVFFVFFFTLSGQAMIRYNNLGSAVYAKNKLDGFEYPPGNRLVVTHIDDGQDRRR